MEKFSFAGLVIDIYDELGEKTAQNLIPYEYVTEIKSQLGLLPTNKLAEVPNSQWGLVCINGSDITRKFPMPDKTHVKYAQDYWLENFHKIPLSMQKVSAWNINKECTGYRIPIKPIMQKVAGQYPISNVISDSTITDIDKSWKIDFIKASDTINRQNIPDEYFGIVDSDNNIRKFAMLDPDMVKIAEQYFETNYHLIPEKWKQPFIEKIALNANRFNIPLDSFIQNLVVEPIDTFIKLGNAPIDEFGATENQIKSIDPKKIAQYLGDSISTYLCSDPINNYRTLPDQAKEIVSIIAKGEI